MVFVNKYIFISLFAALGFFCSLLLFLSDYEENKCEMTYMFQYPQFVQISMKVDKHIQRYGLYSYSEGQFTEKARKMHFNGIPVLFIPGNAGSHKQVRSLASVALRKALNLQTKIHFDYFTVDFNEELSGLNGALLYDQVTYVRQCIHRILELYTSNMDRSPSVVLIGHSMGGLIAEGVLKSIGPNQNLISMVITLATPHKRLFLVFDTYSYTFYNNMRIHDKPNTTIITIFGGFNDFLVPPHLTTNKHFSVVTTHIPKTWLTMDHLCILWCKQLVLVLNRALFDSVDLKLKQISQDKEHILDVFKHYLLHNSGIKINLRKQYELPALIDNTGDWIEYMPRQYSVELLKGIRETHWYMVRLVKQPMHEMLSIVTIGVEATNWIFVCSAYTIRKESRVCVDGIHLSHLSEILPSSNRKDKRKFLNINLHELSDNFTHVVARIPPSNPVVLHVDVHSRADRKIVANLPFWSFEKKIIIPETTQKTLYYEIHFPNLYNVLQSYYLFVDALKCKTQNYHTVATLSLPWSNLDYHKIFTEAERKPMELRLHSQKPPNVNASAFIKLILDPTCRYSVSVALAVPNILGQFARFYSPLIFTNVAVVILLAFASQLNSMETKGRCSLFFATLMKDTKPYYVLPATKALTLILSNSVVLKILPIPDARILDEEGVGFFVAITIYMISVGIVWILAMVLAVSIFCFESTIHNIVLKLISRSGMGTVSSYDWLFKGLKKFPSFVAAVLLLLCVSTCGGLALCLGLIFYFLKLSQMAQDVVENMIMKLIKLFAKKFKISPKLQLNIVQLMLRNSRTNKPNDSNKETKETSDRKRSENCKENVVDGISNIDKTANENRVEEDNNTSSVASISLNKSDQHRNENEDSLSFLAIFQEVTENNELYFHFTIFSLWFLVTCINIPIVLTWAHNFKFNAKLETDPSFIPGIMVCTSALALWQFDYPKIEKKWYKELGYTVYVLAVFSLIYGVFSLFRLNYVLSSIIVLVTLHQLLAPRKIDIIVNENPKDNYERVKAKWE